MHHSLYRFRVKILKLMCLLLFTSCAPVPMKEMEREDRATDMLWLFSIFKENYAPLEYKSKRLGINFDELKTKYLKAAMANQTNGQFYLLMHRFVAEFQDAHTSASLSHGGLPGLAQIAYVGISGKRRGKVFVVTELFPTFDSPRSNFPIRVGDEISHVDGKPLEQIINEELVPAQNLGYHESNLTYHMNRIFTRVSLHDPFPVNKDIELTISGREYSQTERDYIESKEHRKLGLEEKKSIVIKETVPWIISDLAEFRSEQETAQAKIQEKGLFETGNLPSILALKRFDGSLVSMKSLFKKMMPSVEGFRFLNTFYFPNQIETWTVKLAGMGESPQNSKELLRKLRNVPEDADFFTDENAVFPTYVVSEKVHDRFGRPSSTRRLIATMYLNTFSPEGDEDLVVEEFNRTLDRLHKYGIQHLVIDLINNGGGSLSLGLRLAQALSPERIAVPEVQFKISETWLREFLGASLPSSFATSKAEREVAARVFKRLATDHQAGKKISEPLPVSVLMPFELSPNQNLNKRFNVVLLVNEMCASMCDIFAGILQDNNLAKVMGSRTMGAGGNVVAHYYAPNSGLVLRQTESLMLRYNPKKSTDPSYLSDFDKRYIENNGVEPDFPLPVTESSDQGYRPVWISAIKYLSQPGVKTYGSARPSAKRAKREVSMEEVSE